MSGAQWDLVHEEDDLPDAREHAASAMGAARHAADSEAKARGHAAKAEEHAGKLERAEQLLAEVREISEEMRESMGKLDVIAQTVAKLTEALHSTHRESMDRVGSAIEAIGKPRKIVRDDSGRASGIQAE